MKEAEVSLRVAMYYIKSGQTIYDVKVAIDGAQIKTKERINFPILEFMKEIGAEKDVFEKHPWQGRYTLENYKAGIIVHSKSGEGDVDIRLTNGRRLFVESKGFSMDGEESSKEYPKMREAIGQLMTCPNYSNMVDYVVGVPDSSKSREKASEWSTFPQIKKSGIKFILVNRVGDITII